jgi:asparaginyl-tRNA synthetase
VETLRKIMHLRPRTNLIGAVTRVRNACAYATHRFFQDRGFLYIHTPLITASDCEGAGEMFQVTTVLPEDGDPKKINLVQPVKPTKKKPDPEQPKNLGAIDFGQDFFKKPSFLTVSGQLNVECFSCSMSDVYTFGPTFRAEDSHTSRHLAEFWMIEPEIAFADLNDNMRLAEDYLKYCTQFVLDNCADDLAFFDERVEKGIRERLDNVVQSAFARMTYTEAVTLLLEHARAKKVKFNRKLEKKDPLRWGIDLRSEHERYLSEVIHKKPVIITDYPASFKAFYMRMNDGCEEGRQTVRAMDILVPKIGEIIGGAQREERVEKLRERVEAQGQTLEDFSWYADLRRYGTVPHAGFGLGFERLVQFVTGVENIRDVIPFPRWPGNAAF